MKKAISVFLTAIMILGVLSAFSLSGGAQERDASSAPSEKLTITLRDVQTNHSGDYDVQRKLAVGSVFTIYTYMDTSGTPYERVASLSVRQLYDSAYLELQDTQVVYGSRAFTDPQKAFPIIGATAMCNLADPGKIFYNYSHITGVKFNQEKNVLSAFTYRVVASGSTAVTNTVVTAAASNSSLTRLVDEADVKLDGLYLHTTFADPEHLAEYITYPALGDVDSNGKLGIVDATYIQRQQGRIKIPFDMIDMVADADEDGIVTIMDATYIQRSLAGLKSNEDIGMRIA